MMAPRLLLAPAELASVLSIGEWPNAPARGAQCPVRALTFVPVLPVCGAGAAPTRGAESVPKAGTTTRIAGAACVWHRRCDVGGGEDKPSCPVVTNAPTRGAQQELLVLLVCGIGAVPPLLVAVPASAPRDHRPRVVQRRGEACWCNHRHEAAVVWLALCSTSAQGRISLVLLLSSNHDRAPSFCRCCLCAVPLLVPHLRGAGIAPHSGAAREDLLALLAAVLATAPLWRNCALMSQLDGADIGWCLFVELRQGTIASCGRRPGFHMPRTPQKQPAWIPRSRLHPWLQAGSCAR